MELPGYQRPGGQLLPGVDLRGQEAAGVHLPGRLPLQRGGGPVDDGHPGEVQEVLHGPETSQQSRPQLCSHLRDGSRNSHHLRPRELRGKY